MSRTLNAYLLAIATVASATITAPLAARAGTSDPCALVTTADASTAMHVASLPGKPHASRRGASCRYYSPNHQMNVYVQNVQAGDMIGATQLGGKAVPGIGDKAIWSGGSMFVQKGGKVVQVGLYLNAASMQKMDPAIVPLAKTVAGRM
jgi:hypothetical protein